MTLTEKLAKKMARCKRAQTDILKDITVVNRIARKRHDAAAAKVAEVDRLLDTDPFNEELHQRRAEYAAVRAGLNAGIEYGNGLHEMATGKPKVEPERHDIKGPDGLFAKKGSLAHRMLQALKA